MNSFSAASAIEMSLSVQFFTNIQAICDYIMELNVFIYGAHWFISFSYCSTKPERLNYSIIAFSDRSKSSLY